MSVTVNLEYYKIFYYVVKNGSITKAARALNISQPAVSQGIKHLEVALGVSLLIRSSKGIRLTAEGEMLYNHIAPGYESIELGEHLIREMQNLHTGEIRIGASDMTLQFYLLPYLEKFHMLYPNIKVNVTNGPSPETASYLRQGKIDFGVISTPFEDSKNYEIIPVKNIQDTFIAGPKFFQLKNRRLKYRELEHLPLICLEENSSTRKYIDHFLAQQNIVLHPEFELATSDMIVQFALRNLGIGYVMSEFAQPYIDQGLLFPLTFQSPLPKRSFCIIKASEGRISAAAAKMLDILLPGESFSV